LEIGAHGRVFQVDTNDSGVVVGVERALIDVVGHGVNEGYI